MKLLKKLGAVVAMAAVCLIMAPATTAKANEECTTHMEMHWDTRTTESTMHHGYSVGTLDDPKYLDCIVTLITTTYYYKCPNCDWTGTRTTTTTIHSACGL